MWKLRCIDTLLHLNLSLRSIRSSSAKETNKGSSNGNDKGEQHTRTSTTGFAKIRITLSRGIVTGAAFGVASAFAVAAGKTILAIGITVARLFAESTPLEALALVANFFAARQSLVVTGHVVLLSSIFLSGRVFLFFELLKVLGPNAGGFSFQKLLFLVRIGKFPVFENLFFDGILILFSQIMKVNINFSACFAAKCAGY